MKKKSLVYIRSLLIFTLLLTIGQILLLFYVYKSLLIYDKYEIDNYLNNYLSNLVSIINDGSIDKYTPLKNIISPYEDNSSLIDGYQKLINNKKIYYKKTDNDNVYDIYADDILLFTLTLDDSKKVTKLALFTVTLWDIKSLDNYADNGLYNVDLYALSDYRVTINGKDILDSDIKEKEKIDDFILAYDVANVPTINHYKINNLTKEPEIKVYADDAIINLEEKDNVYYTNNEIKYDNYTDAKSIIGDFNPLEVAKIWSLFLSNDASIKDLDKYLISGTDMYKKAYDWATGIDRTFTATHILSNPTFENEYMGNFKFYGKNAFTVDISFNKNIFLTRTNSKRVIPLNETFYFVKYNNEYKLINIMSRGN